MARKIFLTCLILALSVSVGYSGQRIVSGPASSTDNALVRYDSTTGKVLQDGGTTEDDSGNVTITGDLTRGSATLNEAELEILDGATVTTTILNNTSGANTGDDPADDTAYNATSWDANADAATKNAIRDKIETMGGGGASAASIGIALVADHDDFADAVSDIGATQTTLRLVDSNEVDEEVTVPSTLALDFSGAGDLDIGEFSVRSASYRWTQSSYYKTIAYTSGGTHEIAIGDYLEGGTSGATARVGDITLSTGSWAAGTAAGTLTLVGQTGTFQSESLLGALVATTYTNDQCTIGGNTTNDDVYYLEASGGGQPQIGGAAMSRRYSVYKDGTEMTIGQGGNIYWTGIDAPKEDEWVWQDADTLGFSTVYLKTDGTDPDAQAADYYTTGYVVQINGSLVAGKGQHIFTGDGDVGGDPQIREAFPEWWGVDGTADQIEINQALWFHKRVQLTGNYATTDSIEMMNGSSLFGEPRAIWYPFTGTITPSAAVDRAIEALNQRGLSLEGIRIDMSNMGNGSHGVHVAGSFFSSIKNNMIRYVKDTSGTPNTTAGFYFCANSNGSYYDVMENNHVTGGYDQGVGFYFQGDAAFPNLNHQHVVNCTAAELYDGFLLDKVAGTMQFATCASSGNDNNGVTISDHLFGENVGYPTWQGGEVSSNGNYGFEGHMFVIATSSFSNTAGTESDAYIVPRLKMIPNEGDGEPYMKFTGGFGVGEQFGLGSDNTQAITSVSDTIDITHSTITLIPTADIVLSSTPSIPDGFDGQILIIKGSTAHTVRITDGGTLGNSNVALDSTGVEVGTGTKLVLQYDAVTSDWEQIVPTPVAPAVSYIALTASATLNANSPYVRVLGSSEPVTLTSDPQIANPDNLNGCATIVICGASGVDTVTLVDGQGLRLKGNCILGYEDCISVAWIPGWDDWVELSRSNP